MSVFECPVSHFEIEILLIFLIWNRKGSWNVHFLLGEFLEYLACERLSSSHISIRLLIGRVSRDIQNNPTIKSTYTVITITTEFVRLFLFISREKVIVASRNVGMSAKYVLKIYAFGSAHVKFSAYLSHRQSVRSRFPGWADPILNVDWDVDADIHMKLNCIEFDSVYVKYGFWTRRKVISMFYGNRSDFL